MSIYQVKQQVHFKDKFAIQKDGKDVYQVVGEVVSWGDKLSFQDMNGKELAFIKQVKVTTLYPKYEIMKDGEKWAELSVESITKKKEISMEIPGPNDYKITGDLMAGHFKIERTSGALAATVDKKWGVTDTYGVKVEEKEDDVACLLATIVIDQVWHDNKGSYNTAAIHG